MSRKIEKKWELFPIIDENFAKESNGLNKIITQLLFNRGLTSKNDIELFLSDDYEKNIYDPFLFKKMGEAVDLIISHIKKGNKIAVYGDYDADGVTSSVVLVETLETLKAKVRVYIPDRVEEGYGLNVKAIDEFVEDGVGLLITVDNGIRGKREVAYAKEKGIDVIITDHHILPEDRSDLPDAIIINPADKDEAYPFRFLAGVGVAFKLASAIISRAKLQEDDKKRLEDRIMDLVAIGTVADCVTLLGENRALVKRGLEALNNTRRVGLKELIKIANINNGQVLDSWNISFQIAPRVNAAGRMDHANTAFELLITKDEAEAMMIAKRLNDSNIDRQKNTEEIVASIEDGLIDFDGKIIIAVAPEKKSWNEGIVGLAASRISEKYYRPVLVITRGESGFKGSGRSILEFNVIKAVEECSELLEKYGGHPAACGFSLNENNLDAFKEKIKNLAEKDLGSIDLAPKLLIDMELKFRDVNMKNAEILNKLAPFGQNNDRPKFLSHGINVVDILNMGADGQHIKLRLKTEDSSVVSAIGFGQTEQWKEIKIGDKIDLVYYIEINEFNGRREAQLKIIDIKLHNA